MDLSDMINARLERQEEEQDEKQRRLHSVFCQLAAVIGRADYALNHTPDDLNGLREAFEVLRNQLAHLLELNDVELVGKPGEVVDSKRHTVDETRREPGSGSPCVAEILEYGAKCTRDERLLQRARVVAAIYQ
jgi:molecular chaperone GrpE (heat shock protein)